MHRSVLTPKEFGLRLASRVPRILIADSMQGRIVYERATETDFGPQMRRMEVYAMSRQTFRDARNFAFDRFGETQDWPRYDDMAVAGGSFRIPLLMSVAGGGEELKEWAIEL